MPSPLTGNGFILVSFAFGFMLMLVAVINVLSIGIALGHGIALRSLTGTRGVVLEVLADIAIPLIGGALLVLAALKLLNLSHRRIVRESGKRERETQKEKALDTFLSPDEKRIIGIVRAEKHGILQSDIVIKSGYSKVKTHRILKGLENKNLIKRGRFGITNKVILND